MMPDGFVPKSLVIKIYPKILNDEKYLVTFSLIMLIENLISDKSDNGQ